MWFVQRNKYALLCLAVLALSGLLVLRQYQVNQAAHVRVREEFILLQLRERHDEAQHFYQELIQSLPDLSDGQLVDDHERMVIINLDHEQPPISLLLKYKGAVERVLEKRLEARLNRGAGRAGE